MPATLQPGQNIRCTITSAPRSEAGIDTIERLMRQQPEIRRGLRKAQKRRRQNMVVYNRGNRDWHKRETCGKLVLARKGATWIMPYTHQIAPDLASVAGYLSVEPA